MATVMLSGASSFTGLWIAHALQTAGHSVVGLCSRADLSAYENTLAGTRLQRLKSFGIELRFGADSANGTMPKLLRDTKFDYFIFHHHYMHNFRSPKYELAKARAVGLSQMKELVEAVATANAKKIIFSSTYLESAKDSPYGLSKVEIWESLQRHCRERSVALTKIVIGNPIGPFENEDRLIPQLILASQKSERYLIRAPIVKTYPLPVLVLASAYLSALDNPSATISPSIGAMTNRNFAETALTELIQRRLGLKPCHLDFGKEMTEGPTFSEPNMKCDWNKFWDFYADEIRPKPSAPK